MFLPVIISGGSGERLWPVSRASFPKSFITMPDGQSLIQKAFIRASDQPNVTEILTVTNRDHYFKTRSEYNAVNHNKTITSFILEPIGRNTAPAIAMAASYASAMYGDDTILLVLPADQLINNIEAFTQAISNAKALVEQNYLVTFGIKPDHPETGYGYIECGDGNIVKRFVEKPDQETAQKYISSGKHLWNSGIFCFKSATFLQKLEEYSPHVAQSVKNAAPENWAQAAYNYVELEDELFSEIPNISVDYAVMEKSNNVAVIACNIGWSDVGSWKAMGDLFTADNNKNKLVGEVYTHNSSNCFIQSSGRTVAAVGVENLIVIDTPDALLITSHEQAQNVKHIVGRLKECNNVTSKEHRTVFRSWGSYTVLQESGGFKIKRIEVLPNHGLSLQVHKHRSEHWVVVSGKATVQNGEDIFELLPSQSTYIQAGNKHRLQNNENEPLIIVEVQCGPYLGEDDITRLDETPEIARLIY
jgi:mannose-1-phosphate guanylyltransferase / mannose-6-phosphate isomerase